jgi:hypothetical protein
MADLDGGRVNEGNACHLTFAGVEKTAQQQQALGHQFHEAVVADQPREGALPVRQHKV